MSASDPADPTEAAGADAGEPPTVVVYWRPGCGFCSALRHGLERAGVPTVEVDIWRDDEAAAFVRRHAGGNETVPTVDVAGTVLVNPRPKAVAALAREAGIELEEPPPRWWQRSAGSRSDGSPSPG